MNSIINCAISSLLFIINESHLAATFIQTILIKDIYPIEN